MLQLHDLHKTFHGPHGAIEALDGVSLQVEAGRLCCVQGPSGSGKTTLLLAAGALQAPDRGRVLVDGREPYAMSSDERARLRAETIGFVFQRFHLIPYLSVLDNVMAPALALTLNGVKERAYQAIERFQLIDRMDHVPAELSTGERQRVALARALLNQPKLLLADEPTGNLDTKNGEIVLRALAEFVESGGAVLLVTHDSAAEPYAHHIWRLERGKLINDSPKT